MRMLTGVIGLPLHTAFTGYRKILCDNFLNEFPVVVDRSGAVSWIEWSGYRAFFLVNDLELAIGPLLFAITAGWSKSY